MDSSTYPPHLDHGACLNKDGGRPACTRCMDACPDAAIARGGDGLPAVDENACTGCTACVGTCPTSAISHRHVHPARWLERARAAVAHGRTRLIAACPVAGDITADIRVPCHAVWDVTLLAAMAADGVRTLALAGIHACEDCPLRHGARQLAHAKEDYDTLNHALGVKLVIEEMALHEVNAARAAAPETAATPSTREEPPRRAFFRKLLPTLAENAAVAAAQISQAAREAARDEARAEETDTAAAGEHNGEQCPLRPLRLQRFLHALPQLRVNFTPVPLMDALPLGAIQASAACTACGDCIPACPTHALQLKPFGRHRILEFQPDACIGCKRCIAACPEQALEMLPALSLPAVAAGRKRPLIMVQPDEEHHHKA